MPSPQLNSKNPITRERPTYEEMLWEQLQDTKTEIRETRKEINQCMDRIERRMDKIEEKIDALHNEIKSSTGHISIASFSSVDLWYVSITLGVLYSILSK